MQWERKTFRGWHSEHINDPKLIHTWETSQVLEFLLAFRDQLRRHMARQALVLSYLKEDRPKLKDIKIGGKAIGGDTGNENIWDKITNHFEPVTVLGPEFEVYKKVGKRFFVPRSDRNYDQAAWSMLLYGPPGTGKSTLGKNLAAALGVPFITVTVSDFLGGGEAEVEHRAKMVFKVLELQPLPVVLFDEMDQFMLDRDSKLYKDQDSIFQFLTPGMLTKFADLHDSETVIFIIATNYEDRIDPAIKRRGRIDWNYLMLPFDGEARLRILEGFTGTPRSLPTAAQVIRDRVAAASLFLGWGDLKRVADSGVQDINDLVRKLREESRTTRLAVYVNRLLYGKDGELKVPLDFSEGPIEEFGALLNLADPYWKVVQSDQVVGTDVTRALEKLAGDDDDWERLRDAIQANLLNTPDNTAAGLLP